MFAGKGLAAATQCGKGNMQVSGEAILPPHAGGKESIANPSKEYAFAPCPGKCLCGLTKAPKILAILEHTMDNLEMFTKEGLPAATLYAKGNCKLE